jgi:hypothetical protein
MQPLLRYSQGKSKIFLNQPEKACRKKPLPLFRELPVSSSLSTVTVAAEMPRPITTPAHGTAYNIAGKGAAKTPPFKAACRLCVNMARRDRREKAG